MKKFFSIILFVLFTGIINAHPWKPSHYVIIDTDGGIDDIKAISMLLSSHDVRVLAITVSPGVLSAEEAYIKIRSLLNSYYHEGLLVGINRIASHKPTDHALAKESIWGSEKGIDINKAPDILPLLKDVLSTETTKVSFISLGSLNTAYLAIRDLPLFREQVKDIIWSADGADDKEGFNYNIDKKASEAILKQEIPVKIIRAFERGNTVFYDDEILKSLSDVKTPYSSRISGFLKSESAKTHKFAYSAVDEMAVVFLHYPALFVNKTAGNISDCSPGDINGIRVSLIRIFAGETVEENQLIKELPLDPSFYFDDISLYVNEIIDKYGHDEWTAGVFSSEMHRHLGVFEIIGVKMGIRAIEYFSAGVDEFKVLTFAGSNPPLSCMNDGLLVSTGATPGHGLLTVSDDPAKKPGAQFTYKNRKLRITLKPELAEKITAEMKEINFIYGLDSDIYWELVRKNTIKYWKDLDRHEIFVIGEVN